MTVKTDDSTVPSKNIVQLISTISKEAGALVPQMSEGLKFSFRGVAAVTDHLAPHMDKYGVVVIPTVISQEIEMHPVGSRYLTDAKATVQYTFYAPDGSSVSATTLGYAQDYADRAAAQAQSVAMRVALLQVFHLPSSEVEPELNGEATAKITAEEKQKEAKAAPTKTEQSIADVRSEIGAIIADESNSYDGVAVNELGNEVTGKSPNEWGGDVTSLRKILKELKARVEANPKTGEVA